MRKLTKVFNGIFENGDILEDRKGSFSIPINKGKGDALQCGKYRVVRLLELGMKVYEKILENKLRRRIEIDQYQYGFCPGRSTTEGIFVETATRKVCTHEEEDIPHICGFGEGI